MNKKIKKIVGYSIAGILGLLFVFLILVPILQGNLHFLTVLSESMSPNINMGSVVIVASAQPKEIQIGDIITFKQSTVTDPERCVTHRVINITKENDTIQFQTKGDANNGPDMKLVDSSDLIGKVAFSLAYLGYIPHYIKTPIGFVLMIIMPGSLLITYEIRNILRKIKKKDEKKEKDDYE